MFQSNSRYYVKSTITATQGVGTTFLLSTDFELGANLETGTDTVSIVLKNGVQIERFEVTATLGTATIVKRGITQGNPLATDVGLQKQWADGTIAYVTALAYDIIDKQGDTMDGPLTFQPLSTAERTALTPSNGSVVYDTDLGVLYQFIGGAWASFASGTTPFASATVAGKVEIATQGEVDAGTDTGGSGAIVSVIPSTFNTGITNKLASQAEAEAGSSNTKLMTPLRVAQYCPAASTTVAGKVEMATDAEALDGTDEERYINPKQAKDNYVTKNSVLPVDVAITSLGEESAFNATYTKLKEVQVATAGTYIVKTSQKLSASGGTYRSYVRVYKNGSAFGAEYDSGSVGSSVFLEYSENLTFAAGDLVQLYSKQSGDTSWAMNMNLYGAFGTLPTVTINNP